MFPSSSFGDSQQGNTNQSPSESRKPAGELSTESKSNTNTGAQAIVTSAQNQDVTQGTISATMATAAAVLRSREASNLVAALQQQNAGDPSSLNVGTNLGATSTAQQLQTAILQRQQLLAAAAGRVGSAGSTEASPKIQVEQLLLAEQIRRLQQQHQSQQQQLNVASGGGLNSLDLEALAAMAINQQLQHPPPLAVSQQTVSPSSTLDAINQQQRMQLEAQLLLAGDRENSRAMPHGGLSAATSFLLPTAQSLQQQQQTNLLGVPGIRQSTSSLIGQQRGGAQAVVAADADPLLVGRAAVSSLAGSLGSNSSGHARSMMAKNAKKESHVSSFAVSALSGKGTASASQDVAFPSRHQAIPEQGCGTGPTNTSSVDKTVTTDARQKGGAIDAAHVKKQTFPEKVYYMLEDVEEQEKTEGGGAVGTHIISFVADGTAFMIHNPRLFETDVMPLYFSSTRSSSFQRQLNIYSFERVERGPFRGAYRHPNFQKGKPELLPKIVRGKTKRGSSNKKDESTAAT